MIKSIAGGLSHWVQLANKNSTNTRYLLIDKSSVRYKVNYVFFPFRGLTYLEGELQDFLYKMCMEWNEKESFVLKIESSCVIANFKLFNNIWIFGSLVVFSLSSEDYSMFVLDFWITRLPPPASLFTGLCFVL